MTLLEFGKFLWGNPVIDVYITDNPEGFNQESVYSGTFEYLPVKYDYNSSKMLSQAD